MTVPLMFTKFNSMFDFTFDCNHYARSPSLLVFFIIFGFTFMSYTLGIFILKNKEIKEFTFGCQFCTSFSSERQWLRRARSSLLLQCQTSRG